ncbi:Gramicidin S synthase 2 [Nonomuraea coxensis DSM 45129]|uniref:Gramicidin S synthase 2 n=1 Tax=Nonomuraea coxensis DSM 45129 TaxID=1122611 RepID=A0ABX8U923_9ACTN|nr:non-ribosomal peptide synthetase [Nonomuraea coxensis]QYC44243.1 Gramicidin S synthase 2 [Nonomuraea coxensis DSM 45129]
MDVIRGPEIDAETDVGELVVRAAAGFADRVAVRERRRGVSLTYEQLLGHVETQAGALLAQGVKAGDHVVVAVPRSAEEVVAVLAVLSVGAVYVPVDGGLPLPRLRAMLSRVRPVAVIGDPAVVEAAPGPCVPLGPVVITAEPSAGSRPWARRAPGDAVYVTFTSGSTGVPKAVRIPHRGVVRLVRGASYLRRGPGERMLRLAPLAFDASTLEIFCALATGATLEIYPDGPVSPAELATFLREAGVSVAFLTAGLFRVMAGEAIDGFATVRQVLTGGDVVPPDAVRALLARHPGLEVVAAYGPTENTTFSTVHPMTGPADVDGPVPIGRPVAGTTALVLDEEGRPAADGELYLGGSGLALDYLDAPEETARSFVVPPGRHERFYRTGDLVRRDEDGLLHFTGRRDRQVKVRGYRIEPAEIESRLLANPRVKDVAVVVTGVDAGSRRLLAAVVAEPGDDGLVERLRGALREELPGYMVPALWVVIERLPYTRNGKVDVAALEARAGSGRARAVPADAFEDVIAGVWKEVLGTGDFGVEDPFFEIGGDSLLAGRVHLRLRDELPGHPLRIVDIFQYPTVQALAEHLRGAAR